MSEAGETQEVNAAPSVRTVLAAAVAAIQGTERPGQVAMAEAVADALHVNRHLLVQAGTGTGKSLGYLVPAVLHDRRVVVATATLNLQHQLVQRDIPALLEAADAVLGRHPTYAVLKGRSNYACLHRIRDGAPDDQGVLVEVPAGALGAEVVELRSWAEEQAEQHGPGDKDAAPPHTERAWAQVSVSHRECLGAQRCRYAAECFAELAREDAMSARLVVTNHALLAIDAIDGVPMLPDYDAVVVDEAHELTARVTQAATDELSPPMVERAARRARNAVRDDASPDDLADAADALRQAIDATSPGRVDELSEQLRDALAMVRDAARGCWSAIGKDEPGSEADPIRQQARGLVDEVRKIAERMAAGSSADVLWVGERDPGRGGNDLRIAPLDVSSSLRERLFGRKTVLLTSATLALGGGFDPIASSMGLQPAERVDEVGTPRPLARPGDADAVSGPGGGVSGDESGPAGGVSGPAGGVSGRAGGVSDDESGDVADARRDADESEEGGVPAVIPWRGLDVGSPFDYRRQAILYVARHLPPPGRDGLGTAQMDEIAGLVEAAGGRTLGLFSSRRAAEAATAAVRERLPDVAIGCQGEAQLPELARRFLADPAACLFGTLSLWQGVDLPGDTCQLVIVDRIPFPRPDDPLLSARQRAVERRGGNGFMSVAATHAALLLAQGTGRLIRRSTDKGVVAILDPRLVTARYGSFLAASLPPMWRTTDPDVARAALRRLDAEALARAAVESA
ncbi:MAG: ATP-dependent DNA helicase [Nocardioidaceae bacterium]